ncbi:MAG TPA: SDR family NAD(P)-dependent oxidoreductase [Streptosporangiaceae bacterium]
MTAPDGSRPPERDDRAAPGPGSPEVPTPRAEFIRATRQLMRGSRALITGGDAGLGRVIAVGLAREGVDVAIACAPGEPAEDAARTATLVEAEGRRCVVMRGDLADEDTCQEAVNEAVAELGGIDILVNVTAIQSGLTDLGGLDDDRWEDRFRTNLFSFFMATRRPVPHSRKRKGRRRPPSEELVIKNL